MQGCPSEDGRAVRLCYAKLILKATREDWKQHVCNQINKVCEAAESQDYRAVWQGINLIAGGAVKYMYSSVQPTCHYDKTTGKSAAPFETTEERTAVWNGFAIEKFRATPREISDRKMSTLPPKSERADEPEPTDEDLDECLQALGSRKKKAAGEDSIPREVLQSSPEVKADLFNIIRMIWREERVPARMAEGVAIMIFKNKGASNDTSQYRAIMLLQVTWKVLSSYVPVKTGDGRCERLSPEDPNCVPSKEVNGPEYLCIGRSNWRSSCRSKGMHRLICGLLSSI